MFLQIEFKIALGAPFKRLANAFQTECVWFYEWNFKLPKERHLRDWRMHFKLNALGQIKAGFEVWVRGVLQKFIHGA